MPKQSNILSENERRIFQYSNSGYSDKKIAKLLSSSEGYVRKAKTGIRKKLTKELNSAAKLLRLDPDIINLSRDLGLLTGFDWMHNTKVYLLFTEARGIVAWWKHECSDECRPTCLEVYNIIREERGIQKEFDASMPLWEQFDFLIDIIRQQGGQ